MKGAAVLDIVVLVVLFLIAFRLLRASYDIVRMYRSIRSRRLEDASALAPPAPPAVAAVADPLIALGFSRIGERSTVLPSSGRRFARPLIGSGVRRSPPRSAARRSRRGSS
jgi:hypothetical protein